jgi:hypothetical protein
LPVPTAWHEGISFVPIFDNALFEPFLCKIGVVGYDDLEVWRKIGYQIIEEFEDAPDTVPFFVAQFVNISLERPFSREVCLRRLIKPGRLHLKLRSPQDFQQVVLV